MDGARRRRLLLAVVGSTLVMDVGTAALALHTRTNHPEVALYDYLLEGSIGGLVILAVIVVLVLQRPEHRVTLILVASGTAGSLQQLLGGYAVEARATEGSLPAWKATLALSGLFQGWWVILLLLLVVVFPTGRPLAGRLGRLVWLFPPVMLLAAYEALTTPLEHGPSTVGPLFDGPSVGPISIGLSVAAILGTMVHVVVRYHRSGGVERQQLKWFAYSFIVGLILLILPWSESDTAGAVLWTLVPASIVGSIAVAILRYRLYEIDRIISRTVSYALLVGLLGTVFFGITTLATGLLPSDDPFLVAVATLAGAALFTPLRGRVQRFVDRRFNRTRYDAQRVAEDFTNSLRGAADPVDVMTGWVEVVKGIMQPEAISIWVRETATTAPRIDGRNDYVPALRQYRPSKGGADGPLRVRN